MYRFILSSAIVPPSLTVKIKGEHSEMRLHHRVDTSTAGGSQNLRNHLREERERVTVEDFSFSIDLTNLLSGLREPSSLTNNDEGIERLISPTLFVLPDSSLAHRGSVWETIVRTEDPRARAKKINLNSSNSIGRIRLRDSDSNDGGTRQFDRDSESLETFESYRPSWKERRRMKVDERCRKKMGILPWIGVELFDEMGMTIPQISATERTKWERVTMPFTELSPETEVLIKAIGAEGKTGRTARESCDDYCLSESKLKLFELKKEVVGWNWELLERGELLWRWTESCQTTDSYISSDLLSLILCSFFFLVLQQPSNLKLHPTTVTTSPSSSKPSALRSRSHLLLL